MVIVWRNLSKDICDIVNKYCSFWEGSRYVCEPSLNDPASGVNCATFVTGVFDKLYKIDNKPDFKQLKFSDYPKFWFKRYAPISSTKDAVIVEPGDIVYYKINKQHKGHVLIAGGMRNQFWEATLTGVFYSRGSFMQHENLATFKIYRSKVKNQWIL